MESKIKVGAVSYLNTKPLLYGIERSAIRNSIELSVAYPSQLAQQLRAGEIDMALLPVAAMQEIESARIVSDYGIAAHGNVVSVALFSQVPIDEIESVMLDYQSRTSVRLTRLLIEEYWKKDVVFEAAEVDYITKIQGKKAGVIIGDRALAHLSDFPYNYDLSAMWQAHTGLPFVFAAWVSNKDLSADFVAAFNEANAIGLNHLEEIVAENRVPYYDLMTYYTDNIVYRIGEAEKNGLALFLDKIKQVKN